MYIFLYVSLCIHKCKTCAYILINMLVVSSSVVYDGHICWSEVYTHTITFISADVLSSLVVYGVHIHYTYIV